MSAQSKPRMTRQRQVILDELRVVKSHPTAHEIYTRVRRKLPQISLGTVYRNVEVLAAAGAIRKLRLCGAQSRFDGDVSDHYHVRCTRCGRVDDVAVKPLRAIERALRQVAGYQVLGYRLEFTGVCERCATACTGRPRPRSRSCAGVQEAKRNHRAR